MVIVPIDFDLEGNGKLKPSIEKNVFAHVDGEVQAVNVKHSQKVNEGDVLVELKNRELDGQITNIEGELDTALKKNENASYNLNQKGLQPSDKERYKSEEAETKTTITNRRNDLYILQEKQKKLKRTSPITGIVTTWDVERVLNARPVVTGQVLMTIADLTSDWEVEVLMPEKRMRYLDLAMEEAKKSGKGYLDVEFILMSEASVYYKGKLYPEGIGQRAELDAEDGAVVKLRCIPDPDAMSNIKRFPGARVKLDVKCGKRSAAFVVFQDPIEWVRAHVLF